jgi:hypothetical protein
MKKLKCSALAALCFAGLSATGWAQTQMDFITGTHDEFENYLLLNKSIDNTITHWEAEFYQQYYDTLSQTFQENIIRTLKSETIDNGKDQSIG